MHYRVLLFDLFRTVVVLRPGAPTLRVEEPEWRPAMQALRDPIGELLPDVEFEHFLDTVVQVTRGLAGGRAPEYREVPSRMRYLKVLERLGVGGAGAAHIAEQLCSLQMNRLAANAAVPAEHHELLRALARSHPLAMVSNFDHAPTVYRILETTGVRDLFTAVVVSDEFGRRKPHPEIFREALRRLGADAVEALHVGDSYEDDVVGARAAGIDAAWLNAKRKPLPAGQPAPVLLLETLPELAARLS